MARKKREGSYKYLNVAIATEILDQLDKYAEESRIPKTAITEMALKDFLDKHIQKEL